MRVLVTAAHPDDTDFACGGTVAGLVDEGAHVALVVVTSGEAGLPTGAVRDLREHEQRAAAAVLGVEQVTFLRAPDGGVEAGLDLRHALARSIRTVRPDLVITHSPERNLRSVRSSHPDHLAVGQATLAAIYPDARTAQLFPDLAAEGLAPHVVPEVWLHGSHAPSTGVDITDHFDRKMKAVGCHRSQLGGMAPDHEHFFRSWGQEVAQRQHLGSKRLAEEFVRMDTR